MAILLQYNFTTDLGANTTATGVTGSVVTNNLLTSLTTSSGLGYTNEPVALGIPATGATSAGTAITTDSFFYFTITPASGKKISLTTLTFNMARGGAATPRGYDVRSSVDSYAATLGTANIATQRPTYTAVSIDLSGASFQNVQSSITFRVYLFAPSNVNSLDFDTMVLNGTVADGATLEQEGFKWRNDDGTDATATSLASQDTDIIQPKSTNTRLRVLVNSTGDRGSENYQLEFRQVGGSTWTVIT
jgi:hypothetical protein